MIQLYEKKDQCCGCSACLNICPHKAISMVKDEEGFLYPQINNDHCVECKACIKVCAFHDKKGEENILKNKIDKIPKDQEVYAAKHLDEEVRKNSASGGAFTAISDYVLKQNGMIYGAVFNDTFEVVHSCAVNKEQRNRMRGSKYVQSRLGNIFQDIRANLEMGKLVLFTGTPCQCAGLKSYLNKNYANLILCDIVCHGVPSPMLWEDYKKYLEQKYQDKIKNITFRSKDKGWSNSTMKVEFAHSLHRKNMQEDPYYILFFSHQSMRPSCYQCIYASYHRETDLSLADFWGIENINKSFYDDKGISLILANTKRGKEIVEAIEKDLPLIRCNQKDCYQPIFEAPSKISHNRTGFWKEYQEGNSGRTIEKYGKLSLKQKVIKKAAVPLLKKSGLYYIVQKIYYKR